MKVFLSWSGQRSKHVAAFLKPWLRQVIQTVHPWMSSKNIEAGKQWRNEIAKELEETRFGIVCLTPENKEAPWLMFEAGALAKSMDDSRVVPYLIGMDITGLPQASPLSAFQAKESTRDATLELVESINNAFPERPALPRDELVDQFNLRWPALEQHLKQLPTPSAKQPEPSTHEMFREILSTVRALGNRLEKARALEPTVYAGTLLAAARKAEVENLLTRIREKALAVELDLSTADGQKAFERMAAEEKMLIAELEESTRR